MQYNKNCIQKSEEKSSREISFLCIIADENPKSLNAWVNPNTKVKMATSPKSDLSNNRARIASRINWTPDVVIEETVVQTVPDTRTDDLFI